VMGNGRLLVDRSVELAEKVQAQYRECYGNAFRALPLIDQGVYVEGFMWGGDLPFPIEHGWIGTDEGVIDPTVGLWVLRGDDKAAVVGEYQYDVAYIWTVENLLDELRLFGNVLPIFEHYGYTQKYEPMAAAHDRAWSGATGIDFGMMRTLLEKMIETSTD